VYVISSKEGKRTLTWEKKGSRILNYAGKGSNAEKRQNCNKGRERERSGGRDSIKKGWGGFGREGEKGSSLDGEGRRSKKFSEKKWKGSGIQQAALSAKKKEGPPDPGL